MANEPGVFLIHGLGGTQYDLGSMHKRLKNAGFVTHSLTLPGHGTRPEDLVNVPTKQIAYVNVYRAFSGEGLNGTTYQVKASREEADRHAGTLHTRIARLRVEFEPGQMDE